MSTEEMAMSAYVAAQPRYDKRRWWTRNLLMIPYMPLGFIIDAQGVENIPAEGPTILMMNHISYADPLVMTHVIRHRNLISMAKAETMDNLFERTMVWLWANFVIRRGEIDRTALTDAINLLRSGQLVMIAPEGTRHPETGLRDVHDGLAYIATKADAVIVPGAIAGVADWLARWQRMRRGEAIVRFGQPFKFHYEGRLTRPLRQQMLREAMYQLASHIPDSHAHLRGEYADLENASTETLVFI